MKAIDLIAKHVPARWFDEAVDVAMALARRVGSNEERRAIALERLQRRLHVPEHLARLLLELAVLYAKDSPARQTPPDHERAD